MLHMLQPDKGIRSQLINDILDIISVCVCLFPQSLSRLTRVDPAVFLAVIDTCGPAAIFEGVGGSGARVQQHLLTAVATALLTSHIQSHRIAQSQVRSYSKARLQDSMRCTNIKIKCIQELI